MFVRERFPHLYKEYFVFLSNQVAQHSRWHTVQCLAQIPFVTFQAHRLVSDPDTIYNSSSQLLTNIVRFSSLHIDVSLTILKRSFRERFPNCYKECFVSVFNQCGISQHNYIVNKNIYFKINNKFQLVRFNTIYYY